MTDPSPWATALQDLQIAVKRLLPLAKTPDDQANLALIESVVARLAPKVPPGPKTSKVFDATRLRRLLELAGPSQSDELLSRLTEDLTTCLADIRRAAAEPDWKLLRASSHVLISLSGSVGALSLQNMAQTLNTAAHAADRDALRGVMPALQQELPALIDQIRIYREAGGLGR